MPTRCGLKDSKGYFCRWGSHGKKYYYKKGDKASMERARKKADKQGAAAHASGYQGSIEKASDIQSVRFDKKKFNRNQAISWAKSHDFKYNDVEETPNQWRLRQFDPKKCIRSGGMKELAPGVMAYICPTSSKAKSILESLKSEIKIIKETCK